MNISSYSSRPKGRFETENYYPTQTQSESGCNMTSWTKLDTPYKTFLEDPKLKAQKFRTCMRAIAANEGAICVATAEKSNGKSLPLIYVKTDKKAKIVAMIMVRVFYSNAKM